MDSNGGQEESGRANEYVTKECVMNDFYKHLIELSKHAMERRFVAGSRSEIQRQELSFPAFRINQDLLDLDLMCYYTDIYAAGLKDAVPKQFNGRVVRIYSDDLHAGYVKLYVEHDNTEFKLTDFANVDLENMHGPAYKLYTVNQRERNETIEALTTKDDWVASRRDSATIQDRVYAVHSQFWPLQAKEWTIRQRLYGLPSKSTIKEVIRHGCHFVQVSHKLSRDDNEWRISFSRAELIIIGSWTTSQRIIYRALHLLNKIIKSQNKASVLCTYYFKTLMLWATEEKPKEFWSEDMLVKSACKLLYELAKWLKEQLCPNYFIPSNNMVDHLTDTVLSADIDALRQIVQDQKLIVDVLLASKLTELTTYYIETPVWIYTILVFGEQVDKFEGKATRLLPRIPQIYCNEYSVLNYHISIMD